MAVIAHRGASAREPENTLRAFLAALDGDPPADGYECDLRLSADRRPHIFHDADTLRLTGVAGTIEQRRAREIAALRVAGEPIPTLTALLGATLPRLAARTPPGIVNIEIKPTGRPAPSLPPRAGITHAFERRRIPPSGATPARNSETMPAPTRLATRAPRRSWCRGRIVPRALIPARAVIQACRPLLDPVAADPRVTLIVSSFDPRVLAAAQRAKVPWNLALIYHDPRALIALPFLARGQPLALHPADALVTPRHLRQHDLGPEYRPLHRTFRVWTVDDPDRARDLAAMGAAAVITNRPQALRRALARSPQ